MAFHELYFTFPTALSREKEDILIGYVLAVRDSEILSKAARLKATAALQAKVPFNPAKPVLEGYVLQCQMIEDNINEYFVLEPVEGSVGKYVLRLSDSLNMGNVNKVKNIFAALSDKKWYSLLLDELKIESVRIGGTP